MSTYMLWIILSSVFRSPVLAGAAIIIGGLVFEQVAVGVLPSPIRWWRRRSRISRLEHSLLVNPNDRRARFELAESYVSGRRFQKAVDMLKPNLEAGDDDPHTLFVMGVACLGAGHSQQGETFLEAAEAQDPDFRMGEIELERGRFRIERKDFKGAIESLERFCKRRSSSVEGQYLLSKAIELNGDDASAALRREEAWKQYVSSPGFQRKRERLWAWRARPSRPLMYGTLTLVGLFAFFKFAYPVISTQARDARDAYNHSTMQTRDSDDE
jgi:tetratricopeptide (TPR) repeat protein